MFTVFMRINPMCFETMTDVKPARSALVEAIHELLATRTPNTTPKYYKTNHQPTKKKSKDPLICNN